MLLGISVLPALIICGANADDAKASFLANADTKWDTVYDGYVNTDKTLAGVATIDYATTDVEIPDGLQFTGNSTKDSAGGAIKALNGFTIGQNVSFVNNKAEEKGWGGGALYIKLANGKEPSADGKVIIGSNAEFTSNSANLGGAIALEYGDLTVEDGAIFSDNQAGNLGGGAIAIWQDEKDHGDMHSKLTLNNSVFNGNSSTASGGAIANADTGATVTVNGGEFANNTSARGGAIDSYGTLDVDGATFTDNKATKMGGAINVNAGTAEINNSTFENNNGGTYGGAIASVFDTVNLVSVKDSKFTGNSAVVGGAIAAYQKLEVSGSEFTGNHTTTADDGGGAIVLGGHGKATIKDTIFDGNAANLGGAIATRPNGTLAMGDDATSAANKDGHWLVIKNTTFKNNTADAQDKNGTEYKYNNHVLFNGDGGAIWTGFVGTTVDGVEHKNTISGTSFIANTAKNNGGAIFNEGVNALSDVTFEGNVAAKQGGAIFNSEKGTLTFGGTNTFTGNTATEGADIFNNGEITIADGTTTIDGGIAGAGALNIADSATLNIGDAIIEQKSILLDGQMIANLTNRGDNAIFTAEEFSGNGKMSLIMKDAGEYKVFGNAVIGGNKTVDVNSAVYDLIWNDDETTVSASLKSVSDIAGDNGLSSNAATTVMNLVNTSSDKLNDFGLLVQEHLAKGNATAVEHASRAINPEQASVAQSVASNVQGTISKLAANRMSISPIGRSGGDTDMVTGGVWAQGLFNKSKLNGVFDGYTRGVAAGIDGKINNAITIGAGYAFNHSDVDLASRDTEIDSNTIFVYGQYKPADWYVNATLNYTMSDYTESGSALGVAIDSDYEINSFGGQIATGYDFASGITPEVGLRYMHIDGDSYTNSLGIKNKIDDADYLTAIVGAKYGMDIVANDVLKIRPEIRMAAKYDLMSDDFATAVAMPGIESYSMRADRLNRFGGEAGIGLTMTYNDVDISLNYDIEVRKDYTSQTDMLRARYNF